MEMKILAAEYTDDATTFRVWAPLKDRMLVIIIHPIEKEIEMNKDDEGYWQAVVSNVPAGALYYFKPDGGKHFPDPASHFQPHGVHGPSQVTDHQAFHWTDHNWVPPSFNDLIFYELHTGTFTDEGTFDAVISRLDHLVELGINAIELMPVNQFPGDRNWGYDGVYTYAVQNSYGGPVALKRLVDACHSKGIAVFLDVVYNHMGPEGNYLKEYGPYFTDRYKTPWGDALNFDGEWSDGVRDFFAGNALYWFEFFHVDGLRCDAIHMVYDNGAVHFFQYLHQQVKQLEQKTGRSYYLVAESDLNSPKVFNSPDNGGYGFDAQWLDDFHHALYTLLDEKGRVRYEDYGSLEQLAKAYTDGFVLTGEWVKFRRKRYGASSAGVPGNRFVVFNQNHDQIGNRVKGDRLSMIVNHERQKLAAAAIILSPYIPMLFMGEEYADDSPFFYFVSHSDPELVKAVREGRKEEFKDFHGDGEPTDPQDVNTFMASKLKFEKRHEGLHGLMFQWHKALFRLRRQYDVFRHYEKSSVHASVIGNQGLVLERKANGGHLLCIFNFSGEGFQYLLPDSRLPWKLVLDSAAFGTPESPQSAKRSGTTKIVVQPLSAAVYYLGK